MIRTTSVRIETSPCYVAPADRELHRLGKLGSGLRKRLGTAVALAVILTACNKSQQLSGERNPYYVRGLQLRKQNRYTEAADAFEKCLRLSPASAAADLQLATLNEDHLDDPLRAVLHYRAYLTKNPKADNAALVREWQARAEQKLLRTLAAKYPGALTSPSGGAGSSTPHISEQEKRLAQRIKELNTEVLALRSEIRMLTSAASTPATTSKPARPPARGASAPTAPPTVGQTYRVQEGDTLSRISRKFYGTSRHWEKLRDANTAVLHGGDRLVPGMALRIPAQSEITGKR